MTLLSLYINIYLDISLRLIIFWIRKIFLGKVWYYIDISINIIEIEWNRFLKFLVKKKIE